MSKKRKNPEFIDLSGETSSSEADDDDATAELGLQQRDGAHIAEASSGRAASTAMASATIDLTGGTDEDADDDGDDADYEEDPAELRVGPPHHAVPHHPSGAIAAAASDGGARQYTRTSMLGHCAVGRFSRTVGLLRSPPEGGRPVRTAPLGYV